MAQIVVNSTVMREKAKIIENASKDISRLYTEMLQEVNSTAGNMKGTVIDIEKKQFANMQSVFDTFAKDIQSYSNFLNQAAEQYEIAQKEGEQRAQEQGKIF